MRGGGINVAGGRGERPRTGGGGGHQNMEQKKGMERRREGVRDERGTSEERGGCGGLRAWQSWVSGDGPCYGLGPIHTAVWFTSV